MCWSVAEDRCASLAARAAWTKCLPSHRAPHLFAVSMFPSSSYTITTVPDLEHPIDYPWLSYDTPRYNTTHSHARAAMLHSQLPNGSPAAAASGGVVKGPASAAASASAEANTDASALGAAAAAAAATPSLRQVCLELQDKVEAFLAEDVDSKLLKGVQAQVKEAVGVIDEALDRYRYAPHLRTPASIHNCTVTWPRSCPPLILPTAWKSSLSPITAGRTAWSCSC